VHATAIDNKGAESTIIFLVNVIDKTNTAPILDITIPNFTINYSSAPYLISMINNFKDNEADPMTITAASYLLGANPSVSIPGGIFTLQNSLEMVVSPSSVASVGVYTISVTVSDTFGLSVSTSFTVTI
jgi:hypothetical protein